MAQLRFTAVHEDGQHLVLSTADGTELLLPVDERLRAAVRTRGPVPDTPPSQLRPRDVQAMIRAGQTADEVAAVTGWPVDRIARFEAPIVAERSHVAGLARAAHVRGRSEGLVPTLESRVHGRLAARGVDIEATTWDATRPEGGSWTVLVSFVAGQRQRAASWRFEPADRTVEALDDEARWLSEDEQSLPGSAAGKELLGSHGVSEEVDLVTSLRERSRTRGRKRRTPAAPPLPGEAAVAEPAEEDVLPLEDLADPREAEQGDSAAETDKDAAAESGPETDAAGQSDVEEPVAAGASDEPAESDARGEAGGATPRPSAPKQTQPQTQPRSRRRRARGKTTGSGSGGATEGKDSPAATPEPPAPPAQEVTYDVELDFDENYEVDPTPQDATLADLFGPGDDNRYPELIDDDLDTDGFDGADSDLPLDETPLNTDRPADGEDTEPTGSNDSADSSSSAVAQTDTPSDDAAEAAAADTDDASSADAEDDAGSAADAPERGESSSGPKPEAATERSTRRKDGRPAVPSWDDIMFGAKNRE